MKYYGLLCLLAISQISAMDRPLRFKGSSNKSEKLSTVIDIKKLDRLFKILQEKKFEFNYQDYVFAARRLYIHDDLLGEFAARHNISKPEMKELLEIFLNQASQRVYNTISKEKKLGEMYRKEGLTQEQTITVIFLIGLIEEYNHAQDYQDTKTENFLPSRTHQELELISKNVNAALTDKVVLRSFLQIYPLVGLSLLKNFQSQSAQLIAAYAAQKELSLTKNQQQNADYLNQIYKEGVSDFDTYLQLKTNSELDRIRSLLEESRKPAMQSYLLQKMSSGEVNNFQHLYYKIMDIVKLRSKPKKIPAELSEQMSLLYKFFDNYIKEGDKYTLKLTDQDKSIIAQAARNTAENQDAIIKLAQWLSLKPQVVSTILDKIKNLFKKKQPWPDYPEEGLAEQPALPRLPIIEQPRVITSQDFINYALENNPRLNGLINSASNEQLNTVKEQADALIKADEKVIKKYQERFEVTPRRDLAKLRLLVQSIDQELKQRKEELFRRHPMNKPHPEYPESPR